MILSPYATRFTLYGERNLANRKPYRSQDERKYARQIALLNPSGHFTSSVPRRHHNEPSFNPSKQALRHYAKFRDDCRA